MEIGKCSVFVAFRCALFYTTFLSPLFFFQKTLVNAQQLNPHFVFEEITALKNIYCRALTGTAADPKETLWIKK